MKSEVDDEGSDMQWISVKDRLPEIDEDEGFSDDVLIAVPGSSFAEVWIGYLGRTGTWRWEGGIPDAEVTHWMPLPELPK